MYGIFSYMYHKKTQLNVGKYMDPMGYTGLIPRDPDHGLCFNPCRTGYVFSIYSCAANHLDFMLS